MRWKGFSDIPADVLAIPLVGARTLVLAARAIVRRPLRALRACAALMRERYPVRAKLKNLAVIPKGLALAELARTQRFDRLHAYWLSTPATVAWLASRVSGIPFSATTHRWDLYENNMARRKLADASFIRTISARGRADLLRMTAGDERKVRLVRIGVPLSPVAPDSPQRGPATPLRILCAARLVAVKGHRDLIEALALLRRRDVPFVCTLAGSGELRDELERRIASAGLLDRVRLAGTIAHDELVARLQAGEWDVSVIASIERRDGLMEGVPVALLEAMAAGVVVVATDSGAIGELVDAETGLLVPHSQPDALAAALAQLSGDRGLYERLRHAARERVEREFDARRTAATLRELISA